MYLSLDIDTSSVKAIPAGEAGRYRDAPSRTLTSPRPEDVRWEISYFAEIGGQALSHGLDPTTPGPAQCFAAVAASLRAKRSNPEIKSPKLLLDRHGGQGRLAMTPRNCSTGFRMTRSGCQDYLGGL